MQSLGVVDLVDETRKVGSDILEGLVGGQIDGLDLQSFHETLCLCAVVRIAAAAHRTLQAMGGQPCAVGFGCILGSSIGMMNAAFGWSTPLDSGPQSGNGETGVHGSTDRV